MKTKTRDTLVELTSGERLACPEKRDDGVVTDAGLIPWRQVEGFWVWHKRMGRYFFIAK
jgi:hypothetical protein